MCKVVHERKISDHSWVKAVVKGIGGVKSRVNKILKKRVFDKNKFSDLLVKLNSECKEVQVEKLYEELEIGARQCVTTKEKLVKIRRVRWWDEELKKLRVDRDNAYRNWIEEESDERWKRYKVLRNLFVKIYRKKKRNYYEENLRKNGRDGRKTWRILNELLGRGKEIGDDSSVVIDGVKSKGIGAANDLNKFFVDSVKSLRDCNDEESRECNDENGCMNGMNMNIHKLIRRIGKNGALLT